MDDPETFFSFTSFNRPTTIYRYDVNSGKAADWAAPKVAFNPDDYSVEQVFYNSKDGTRVPMFIVKRKDVDRPRADAPLRLRRLQRLADAELLRDPPRLAGERRRLCARQPSRRRRIWQGVARGRPPRAQAERVRRLHRRRRISEGRTASLRPRASRSRAARTAVCSSVRWSTSAPTCSTRPMPRSA